MSDDGPWRCTDVRAHLADHLDGELAAAQASAIVGHLAGCSACRAEFDEARRMLDGLRRRAQAIRMPDDVRERLRASLERASVERATEPAPDASSRSAQGATPLAGRAHVTDT
jgi:anti-sigma factor (TIGR02949 family)